MSSWFEALRPETVAGAVFLIGIIAAAGCALGSFRFFGVRLGIAGVLFVGLLFGHFHIQVEHHVLDFVRDFGLILFVYAVGLQVAPGFFSSLRKEGLALNLLAAANVALAAILIVAAIFWGKLDAPIAVGVFSGATTNTPSLAAAQTVLKDLAPEEEKVIKRPAQGYAVAYPFGVFGIILTMLFVKKVFRVDAAHENHELSRLLCRDARPVERRNIKIENPKYDGALITEIPEARDGLVLARLFHEGEVSVITPETRLHTGDVVLAVGQRHKLRALESVLGRESELDLHEMHGAIRSRRILVTRKEVVGKTVDDLDLDAELSVQITRVRRGDVDLTPGPGVRLQFGDSVIAVGEEKSLDAAAKVLGDSAQRLERTEIIPFFLGIAVGVLLGTLPLPVPGLSAPVKLGLAGGPLIVAIIAGSLRRIGPLMWFVPAGANFMLRDLGIILFLAAVGLKAGDGFVESLVHEGGLSWMLWGVVVTLLPLVIVSFFARIVLHMNFVVMCGLLAGSMTDPPALAFAGSMTGSESPYVAYAAVYPLTMILRILTAQFLMLMLYGVS